MQRWEYCRIELEKSGDEVRLRLYTPEGEVRFFRPETFKDTPNIWDLHHRIESDVINDGWELFRESNHNSIVYYYFKRPIPE